MFSVTGAHPGSTLSGAPPASDPPFRPGGHPSRRASLDEARQTPSPLTLPIDIAGMLASDEQWIVDALLHEMDAPSSSTRAERQPTPPSDPESTPRREPAARWERAAHVEGARPMDSAPPVGGAPLPRPAFPPANAVSLSGYTDQLRAMQAYSYPPNAYPYPCPAASGRPAMWQSKNNPQPHAKLIGGRKTARPRVEINRQLILKASEELRRRQTTMRYFSVQNAVTERHVRIYVLPDGSLTPWGQRVTNQEIRTPADRAKANLEPGTRTALTPEEFELGAAWIGTAFGKLPRTMFCELLGLDPYIVPSFFKKDGSLTERGYWAREAAIARHGGRLAGKGTGAPPHAHAAPALGNGGLANVSRAAPAAGAGEPPAVPLSHGAPSTAEARLEQLAVGAGISLGFWRGDDFRRLGRAGAPFLGTVDSHDGFWLIFPARGKQYHLARSADETRHMATMTHIVNILQRDAEGPLALVDQYRIARRDDTDAILVTPRPEVFPGDPPAAATPAG